MNKKHKDDAEKKKEKISIRDSFTTSWRLIRLVWKYNKFLFTISLLTILIPTALGGVNLYIIRQLTNFIVAVYSHHTPIFPTLYFYLGVLLVIPVITGLTFSLQSFVRTLMWIKTPDIIQQIYTQSVSQLDQQTLENSEFKSIMHKASNSIYGRPQQLIDNIGMVLQSIFGGAIYLGFLARANVWIVVILLLVAIPEFIRQTKQSQQFYNVWSWRAPIRKRIGYLTDLLIDYRQIKEIKLYNLREKFLMQLQTFRKEFYEDNKKLAKENIVYIILSRFASTFTSWGIDAYVVFQVIYRNYTLGDLQLYTLSVSNFQGSLSSLFSSFASIYEQSQYIRDVFLVIDTKPAIIDSPTAIPLNNKGKAPEIKFEHVTFAYPDSKKNILNDFSLTIESGQKVAFVGENGAGKSTVIKLLARLYEPSSGTITIDNHPLNEIKLNDWREKLGILFQDYGTYHATIKENIHYGDINREYRDAEITHAARDSGASSMITELPDKFDQMLGKTFEGGIELSGGQWQKVALAKSFYRNADVLILDEPTAAIDAKAEAEIFDKVQRLSKNKTVLIISHRFSTVRHADIIYVLDKGKIIESGNHEQLMKKESKYAELFTLQAKGYQ